MCRNSCAWYLEVGSVALGLDSDFEEEKWACASMLGWISRIEERLDGEREGPTKELVYKIGSGDGYGRSLLAVRNPEDESADRVLLLSSWSSSESKGLEIAGFDVPSTWRKPDSTGDLSLSLY